MKKKKSFEIESGQITFQQVFFVSLYPHQCCYVFFTKSARRVGCIALNLTKIKTHSCGIISSNRCCLCRKNKPSYSMSCNILFNNSIVYHKRKIVQCHSVWIPNYDWLSYVKLKAIISHFLDYSYVCWQTFKKLFGFYVISESASPMRLCSIFLYIFQLITDIITIARLKKP